MKPRIGINLNYSKDRQVYSLDPDYVRAVKKAGGVPVLLPFVSDESEARELLASVHGVIFTGGADIDPRRWGEEPHPKTELLWPERERSDELLMRAAIEQDVPTLCICCGFQQLNVLFGGSLHQHLPDLPGIVEAHAVSKGKCHEVELLDGQIRQIVGAGRAKVNSYHHQAVNRVGRGLLVTARSEDGFIEGLEVPGKRFVLGVQWHPERMLEEAPQLRLFEALVSVASRVEHLQ